MSSTLLLTLKVKNTLKPIERFQALLDGTNIRAASWKPGFYIFLDLEKFTIIAVDVNENYQSKYFTQSTQLFDESIKWELYEEPKPDTYTGYEYSNDGVNWIRGPVSRGYTRTRWIENGVCPTLEIRGEIKLTPEMVGKRVRLRGGMIMLIESHNPHSHWSYRAGEIAFNVNGIADEAEYNIVEVYP